MNNDLDQKIQASAAVIREKAAGLAPKIALILGSGLGDVADLLQEKASIPYTSFPGFPEPGVGGHEGTMRIGTVSGVPCVFLKGRVHPYEGKGFDPVKVMIRTLKTIGIDTVFLTNAAGSLQPGNPPGSIVAITDHINLLGMNPLTGPNDEKWGPRFPSMNNAWDADLRALLLKQARAAGVQIGEGVYAAFLGPTFETPAEIGMAKAIGADLVGMSTVPELILARHCGLKCVGCSGVTNMAAGMSDESLTHEHTLETAKTCSANMAKAVAAFMKAL